MITTGKPDVLQLSVPPSFTAKLAERAGAAGVSTVDWAYNILRGALESQDAKPKTRRNGKEGAV